MNNFFLPRSGVKKIVYIIFWNYAKTSAVFDYLCYSYVKNVLNSCNFLQNKNTYFLEQFSIPDGWWATVKILLFLEMHPNANAPKFLLYFKTTCRHHNNLGVRNSFTEASILNHLSFEGYCRVKMINIHADIWGILAKILQQFLFCWRIIININATKEILDSHNGLFM